MTKPIRALHRLQWRLCFALLGNDRVPTIPFAVWWDWSDTEYDEMHLAWDMTPREAVGEEISAMCS